MSPDEVEALVWPLQGQLLGCLSQQWGLEEITVSPATSQSASFYILMNGLHCQLLPWLSRVALDLAAGGGGAK